MADAKKTVPATAPATKKKSRGTVGIILGIFMAIGSVAMLPTTLLFAVGMIPSAVAYFVDPSREKTLGPTVLFLNFAGVMPSLLKLWRRGHSVTTAIDILTEPSMMLIILLPAAVGWVLYAYVPLLVSGIVRRNAELRIRSLEKDQESLVSQWGSAVMGSSAQAVPVAEAENKGEESSLV